AGAARLVVRVGGGAGKDRRRHGPPKTAGPPADAGNAGGPCCGLAVATPERPYGAGPPRATPSCPAPSRAVGFTKGGGIFVQKRKNGGGGARPVTRSGGHPCRLRPCPPRSAPRSRGRSKPAAAPSAPSSPGG